VFETPKTNTMNSRIKLHKLVHSRANLFK